MTIAVLYLAIGLKAQVKVRVQDQYIAGEEIRVFIEKEVEENTYLKITHAAGSALLRPAKNSPGSYFEIPEPIRNKSGVLDLELIGWEQSWKKQVAILPDTSLASIEAYCGPKHLVVDRSDFTMITAMVLDEYDNPFPKETQVEMKAFINEELRVVSSATSELSAYQLFYAPGVTGNGAISSVFKEASSKEFRLTFYANDPEHFQLLASRQHGYADGGQLVKIYTSEIRDRNENIVENGTMVQFEITDSQGQLSFIFAETIEGVAIFEIPAPLSQTNWLINALIPNYAKSDTLNLAFKKAFDDLPVAHAEDSLVVGPIKSYMGQFAKYGLPVEVDLKNNERKLNFSLPIKNGFVVLRYQQDLIPTGEYEVTCRLGTLENTFKITVP